MRTFSALLVSAAVADDPGFPKKYSFYHTTDGIEEALNSMSCEGFSFQDARDTANDEISLPVVRLEQLGDRAKTDPSETMLVFGEHPRELISAEVGLNLVHTLCSEAGREARAAQSFTLVLNANPEGRRKIQNDEDWCVRTNEHDVDLNRNYGQGWVQAKEGGRQDGIGIKAGRKFEIWSSGGAAFSEPETQVVREILEERKPHTFVDVHSGTQAVILPWAYTTEPIEDKMKLARMMKVGRDVSEFCPDCSLGPGAATVGYEARGTASDYAFSQGVPYSFTTEIFAGGSNAVSDRMDKQVYEAKKEVLRHDGKESAITDDIDSSLDDPEKASEESAEAILRSADIESESKEKKHSLNMLTLRGRVVKAQFRRGDGDSILTSGNLMSEMGDMAEEGRAALSEKTSDCFTKFNPSSKSEYDEVVTRWTKALLRLCASTLEADSKIILPGQDS